MNKAEKKINDLMLATAWTCFLLLLGVIGGIAISEYYNSLDRRITKPTFAYESNLLLVEVCALKTNAWEIVVRENLKLGAGDCYSFTVDPNNPPKKPVSYSSNMAGEGLSVSVRKY